MALLQAFAGQMLYGRLERRLDSYQVQDILSFLSLSEL